MGGCRNRSVTTSFAPPSPNAIGHTYPAPGLPLDIIFDKAMDTSVVPALGNFEIVVDGVPETPTGRAWQNPTTLQFTFVSVPAISGVWNQLQIDTNLRGSDMSLVKLPQSQTFHP